MELSHRWRRLGAAIFFLLLLAVAACSDTPTETTTDPCVPGDALRKSAYLKLTRPPEGFTAVLAWAQTVQKAGESAPSLVEVDYLRLYARVRGETILLDGDEYDTPELDGGLYGRHPHWFATDQHRALPGTFRDGCLILEPSEFSDSIGHWWNTSWPRASVPAGTERVWMEMKFKIIGPAFVQVGIDFWRTPTALYAGPEVNNREAGASAWACDDTDDWQVLAVAEP